MNQTGLGIAALFAALWASFLMFRLQTAQAASPVAAIRGKAIFQARCTGCHSLDRDDEGPRLRGVYGRTSGTVPGFPYSDALKQADIVWNDRSLEEWLTHPQTLVPGSGMPVTVTDPGERHDLIAYLKENSCNCSLFRKRVS